MSDAAVIQGSLVDVRNIGHDKAVVLKIHVPAERALAVIEAFGWPTQVSPVAVAIARLVESEVRRNESVESDPVHETEEEAAQVVDRPARSPTLPAAQAGFLCNTPRFQQFVAERISAKQPLGALTEISRDRAADYVREFCGVRTRALITPGTEAEQRWLLLKSAFKAWEAAPRAGVPK